MPKAVVPARAVIVAVVVVMLATSACGSSSKSSDSSSTTASSPPTSAPVAVTPTTAETFTFTGSSDSTFCAEMRADEGAFRSTNIATKTPPQVKALYMDLVPKLESAASHAPTELTGDFATFVTAYKQLVKALAAAQYNYENLDPTTISTLDTPQVQAASGRIQQYMTQVCKITTTT